MLPKGWRMTTVGKSCAIRNTLRYPLSAADRASMVGKYPYFGPTGQLDSIDHYRIDEPFALIGEDGDHFLKFRDRPMTLYFSGKANVNNHAHIIGDSVDCLAKWFYYCFMFRDITPALTRQGVGRYKLTKAGLEKLELALPPKPEQVEIVEVLSTWDQAIAKAEQLLHNSLKRRRGITKDLILGKRRFPQFKAPWQQLTFRDVLEEVKRRVDWDDDQSYPLISVRRRSEGAFHRETLKGSEILTKKLNYAYEGEFLISKMQVVHGAMAVVPAELNGMLVSDSYLAFQSADAERIDINFIGWLSTTQQMYKAVRRCSYGVHIEKMTFDLDMFLNEKLQVPIDLAEQRLICGVLESMQVEIKVAADHLAQLKKEKAALMSQLLTGKRRVKFRDAPTESQT